MWITAETIIVKLIQSWSQILLQVKPGVRTYVHIMSGMNTQTPTCAEFEPTTLLCSAYSTGISPDWKLTLKSEGKVISNLRQHCAIFLARQTGGVGSRGEGGEGIFHPGMHAAFTNAAACVHAHPPLLWPSSQQAVAQHWAADRGLGDPCSRR